MRIVAISDTHGDHDKLTLPYGDVLVHAGNIGAETKTGFDDFIEWFGEQTFDLKIFIAGTVDTHLARSTFDPETDLPESVTYLEDSGCVHDGFSFWGSPWTPEFRKCSFKLARGRKLKKKWDQIPAGTDLILTHCPPYGHGDVIYKRHSGCFQLLKKIVEINPKYHVFGHIHDAYGRSYSDEVKTKFANVAIVKNSMTYYGGKDTMNDSTLLVP